MISLFSSKGNSQDFNYQDFQFARINMMEKQIKARGIKDENVLRAMAVVPRHLFVPKKYQHEAYKDYPLPIGEGQTISQPYIVAFMTEALNLDSTFNVLEVGTGSGYQAAILGEICKQVFTIEIYETLGNSAAKIMKELGYKNIHVKIGDGYNGWREKAPFDAIIVTCSPTHIPDALTEQLKEGGTIIIPIGKFLHQELILLMKENGIIQQKNILPVRFVPMINQQGVKY